MASVVAELCSAANVRTDGFNGRPLHSARQSATRSATRTFPRRERNVSKKGRAAWVTPGSPGSFQLAVPRRGLFVPLCSLFMHADRIVAGFTRVGCCG